MLVYMENFAKTKDDSYETLTRLMPNGFARRGPSVRFAVLPKVGKCSARGQRTLISIFFVVLVTSAMNRRSHFAPERSAIIARSALSERAARATQWRSKSPAVTATRSSVENVRERPSSLLRGAMCDRGNTAAGIILPREEARRRVTSGECAVICARALLLARATSNSKFPNKGITLISLISTLRSVARRLLPEIPRFPLLLLLLLLLLLPPTFHGRALAIRQRRQRRSFERAHAPPPEMDKSARSRDQQVRSARRSQIEGSIARVTGPSGVKNARASIGSVSRAHRRVGRRVCRSVMPRECGRASKRGVSRKKLPRDKGDQQQRP